MPWKEETFPDPPDALVEQAWPEPAEEGYAVYTPYGTWWPVLYSEYGSTVHLTGTAGNKQVENRVNPFDTISHIPHWLRHESKYMWGVDLQRFLDDDGEFRFKIYVDEAGTGEIEVWLKDPQGQLVSASYNGVPRGRFVELRVPLKSFVAWEGNIQPFNWMGVVEWRFYAPQTALQGLMAVKDVYFWRRYYESEVPTMVYMNVQGAAAGTVTLIREEYSDTIQIPSNFSVDPPDGWYFEAHDEYFSHWLVTLAGGEEVRYDTRKIGPFTFEVGSENRFTEVMVGAPPDEEAGPPVGAAVATISVFSAAVAILYLVKDELF